MITKLTIVAFFACSIAILPAQTTAQEKPATEKSSIAAKDIKAETPVEKQAFKIVDSIASFPDVLESIQDKTSLEAAEVKLNEMLKQFKKENAALLKLKAPDNEARKKLNEKLRIKIGVFQEKMFDFMIGGLSSSHPLASEISQMVTKFEETIEGGESLTQYLKPDEIKKEK